jgi:thiol-disulfide isomerase/thioredoxin
MMSAVSPSDRRGRSYGLADMLLLGSLAALGLLAATLLLAFTPASARAGILDAPDAAVAAGPDSPQFWHGRAADGGPTVRLYFFWTPTCPHCRAAKPFVEALPSRFPWLEIVSLPVKENPANARLYYETAKHLGADALSVPGFLFCRQASVGYDAAETTGAFLVRELEQCHAKIVADPSSMSSPLSTGARTADSATHVAAAGPEVVVPLLGKVGAETWSLPVLTLVLAGVDAFNPCAFFVLLFLLSLLVHARSRARMLAVGGTFVLISGLAYFAFMAAWLNVFLIAGEMRVVTLGAGLLALTIGAINVKDYFWFKQGVSLSIPESAKPSLYRRMREVATAGSMGPMLASTVLLAIVANSYELLCTAGFPMVYTRALTLANLETWQRYAWLAAYNVIYVVPLLAIVLVFVKSMGTRKLSEAEGRALKLVSGYMMAAFGLVLLFVPTWLTSAFSSLLVLGAALAAAVITVLVMPGARPGKPATT